MNNKSFSRIPYYLFRQRIPLGHPLTTTGLKLVTLYPKTEMRKNTLLENILQWEDDGGRIVETQISTPDQLLV